MTRRTFVRRPKVVDAEAPAAESEEAVAEPTAEPVIARPEPREPAFDAGALEELAGMTADDFAAAMDGMSPAGGRARHEVGDEAQGIVVGLSDRSVFVDIGAKAEATIDREELPDAAMGESVTARVLASGERGIRLGIRLRGAEVKEHLVAAKDSAIPIEGRVTERNKGGFVVDLSGVRAFCPVSRIDPRPGEDLDVWIGRTLSFRVVEIGARDVVVDRRKLVEEERAIEAEKTWGTLAEGQRKTGRVESVHDFGVFVEVNGIKGLVPKGELGETELTPGEEIQVRIARVDRQRERLSLSLGQAPARGLQPAAGSLGTFADLFAQAKKK
ncbi:MAG: S1 RNA-binding domain-containing protein [Proteobacteria bacterium]|nr:S1 RNA-binding domain-containing protein [Pseudomonadota bacterium]MCP4920152.1 S1 RNA-binding domain-containing protein [Pseudomonadota bacterium]